ncbi:MAG: serpin family protein [Coriobacteriia bacterium]|nr:serpin family protein [Coriobacteriia bacterium]
MAQSISRRGAVQLMGALGAAAMMGSLAGCGNAAEPGKPADQAADLVKNGDFPSVVDGAADPSFSARVASQLLAEAQDNSCFSPASLYVALTLLTVGVSGTTQQQLVDQLGEKDAEALSKACQAVISDLTFGPTCGTGTDEDPRLMFANSLWVDMGFEPKPDYAKKLEDDFDAQISSVDFADPKTNETVSNWVSEKTMGLLKPQFQFDAAMALALVNTLYFRDSWPNPFEKSLTEQADFAAAPGAVKADFMHTVLHSDFAEFAECQVGELRFASSGAALRFMLPWEGGSTASLMEDPALLEALLVAQLEECQVTWSLPKFTIENTYDLVPTLQQMGLTAMFESSKDFESMVTAKEGTTPEMAVSMVQQGTKIAVDEDGALAAAYTAIGLKATALPPQDQKEVEFTLDRPFVYALIGRDGTPLFVGLVQDPTA